MRVVTCPDWRSARARSLRCGLAALGDDVEAALIVLADGPQLDPRAVERLIEHRDDADVVVASYDGTRDHPAVLSRAAWAAIPDEGARALDATLVAVRRPRAAGRHGLPASLAAARRRLSRAATAAAAGAPRASPSAPGGIGSSTATLTKRRRSSSKRYRLSQPGQLGEVLPRLLHLVVGQDSVEVGLHHRLAVITTTRHSAHHHLSLPGSA